MKYGDVVYGTQGGGLAVSLGSPNLGLFEFVEAPDWWPEALGQLVPEDWDLQGPFIATLREDGEFTFPQLGKS